MEYFSIPKDRPTLDEVLNQLSEWIAETPLEDICKHADVEDVDVLDDELDNE